MLAAASTRVIITNDQEPSPPLDEPNTNGLEGISNDDDDPQTLVS